MRVTSLPVRSWIFPPPAEVGHAQVGRVPGGQRAHGRQLLRGGGQGGLDRGDLPGPALLVGLLESVGEVGVICSSRGSWAGSTRRRGHLTQASLNFEIDVAAAA